MVAQEHIPTESKRMHPGGGRARQLSTGAPGPIRRELGTDLINCLGALCEPRTRWAIFDLIRDYGAIVAVIATGLTVGGYVVPVAAAIFVGFVQRWLANLVHECSHHKFFKSRRLNDRAGQFIATSLLESFLSYEDDHRVHHAKLGRDGDPKLRSYCAKGATTPVRDRWSFIVHVVVANALWTLPVSTVRGWFTKPAAERWAVTAARALAWILVVGAAIYSGNSLDLLVYWILPLIFVRAPVNWLTDLGNHAGLIENPDPIVQTRGWTSHVVTRFLFGGHLDDMYHPVHHWCPQIPYRALPAAAALLAERYPRFDEVSWCSGFFFRRRSTPGVPSVVEDIVTRLRPTLA